jgi:hypothetical protein
MDTNPTITDLLEAVTAHLATYDALPEVVEAERAINRLLAAFEAASNKSAE